MKEPARRTPFWLPILVPLLALLLRGLASTWRIEFEGKDPWDEPDARLGALWHRNLIIAAGVFVGRPVHVTVSRSRDGDLAVAVMQQLGFAEPPRGSSRRGGVGLLREIVRAAKGGGQVVIPVDGPVGPARRAKPGVLQAARLSHFPVYPVGLSARRSLRFRSWDRMLLPLPFARIRCCYGEPLPVPETARSEEIERLRVELDRRLEALTDAADAAVGLRREMERPHQT